MSIIEQIKQRFNNNQLETEKLKLQLSNIKSTLVSIKVVKQICDIDLDQLELISEYVTKAKVDLPTGIIDWRSKSFNAGNSSCLLSLLIMKYNMITNHLTEKGCGFFSQRKMGGRKQIPPRPKLQDC